MDKPLDKDRSPGSPITDGETLERSPGRRAEIESTIVALLKARAHDRSICPSEAARQLAATGQDWRAWMPAVREAAVVMAEAGTLTLTRGAETLAPAALGKGPIRLRRGRRFPPFDDPA